MTKAYEDYHNTFMAETTALIELFGGLLQGSKTADEINQQADQHFANLKDAATQYWEERDSEKFDKELTAPSASQTLCHAVAEGANLESLPCAGDDLPFDDLSRCGNCEYAETVVTNAYCGSCQYHLEHQDCDPDCDLDRQQLKEEVRQAYLNGGRTPYLYNIDGNEYYTTRDGIRHYTRVEG